MLISHGKLFVFRVGLAQLFVGVRLSEFPFWLQRVVFCLTERWQGGKQCFFELARLIFWFGFVGLAGFSIWLSPFFV